MEQDLKDALKYISDQGYGSGTNWNTKLVAVLLANYAHKLASDGVSADVRECLIQVNETLERHGKIDANTELHGRIRNTL